MILINYLSSERGIYKGDLREGFIRRIYKRALKAELKGGSCKGDLNGYDFKRLDEPPGRLRRG